MGFDKIVSDINNMDWLQKQLIYLNYYARVLTSNYFSYEFGRHGVVVEKLNPVLPVSFDEFCSPENIMIKDMGEDWERRGYAQRIRKDFHMNSIYRYYQLNITWK